MPTNVNETYERYCFNVRAQQPDEPFDSFVSDLRGLAKSCSFCNCLKDSLIRDSIVVVGGAVTSCAGISAAFVCTCSSKQIYPVSIQSDFLAGEVSNP